jgi:hypothetical protein
MLRSGFFVEMFDLSMSKRDWKDLLLNACAAD